MSEDQQQVSFQSIKDKVNSKVKIILDSNLSKRNYNSKDVQNWTSQISDQCIKVLTDFNKNFKYMVNCIILQKSDSGLSISGSCYWDQELDGNVTVTFENQNLVCIVNVFGVAL